MLNNKHRVLSTFMSVYAAILFDGHKDQYMVVCWVTIWLHDAVAIALATRQRSHHHSIIIARRITTLLKSTMLSYVALG